MDSTLWSPQYAALHFFQVTLHLIDCPEDWTFRASLWAKDKSLYASPTFIWLLQREAHSRHGSISNNRQCSLPPSPQSLCLLTARVPVPSVCPQNSPPPSMTTLQPGNAPTQASLRSSELAPLKLSLPHGKAASQSEAPPATSASSG